MEAAGIVDEVGADVPDRLKLGDAVMAIVVQKGSHGAYREEIVLDARSVVRAPAGKSHVEAATLPMNGLTARLSLDLLKLSPGQVIAVTGAAGTYGGYVIQLAKTEGLTGAFTSVRGFQGIPQRDIRFAPTFVRSYAQEWEKARSAPPTGRGRRHHASRGGHLSAGAAADAHRRLEAGGTRGRLVIQF